jgi:periplasmic divalent cation tolerance protein
MTTELAAEDFLLVLVTAPDSDTAARLGKALVDERLAACVNIVPGLRSIYVWQEKACDEAEVLCLIKTRASLYPALRDRVAALHPYDTPEIIGLPLAAGNAPYLAWLAAQTEAAR